MEALYEIEVIASDLAVCGYPVPKQEVYGTFIGALPLPEYEYARQTLGTKKEKLTRVEIEDTL